MDVTQKVPKFCNMKSSTPKPKLTQIFNKLIGLKKYLSAKDFLEMGSKYEKYGFFLFYEGDINKNQ